MFLTHSFYENTKTTAKDEHLTYAATMEPLLCRIYHPVPSFPIPRQNLVVSLHHKCHYRILPVQHLNADLPLIFNISCRRFFETCPCLFRNLLPMTVSKSICVYFRQAYSMIFCLQNLCQREIPPPLLAYHTPSYMILNDTSIGCDMSKIS